MNVHEWYWNIYWNQAKQNHPNNWNWITIFPVESNLERLCHFFHLALSNFTMVDTYQNFRSIVTFIKNSIAGNKDIFPFFQAQILLRRVRFILFVEFIFVRDWVFIFANHIFKCLLILLLSARTNMTKYYRWAAWRQLRNSSNALYLERNCAISSSVY